MTIAGERCGVALHSDNDPPHFTLGIEDDYVAPVARLGMTGKVRKLTQVALRGEGDPFARANPSQASSAEAGVLHASIIGGYFHSTVIRR